MSDSKFYGAVALIAVVLIVADLSYFSGLDVAQASPSVETSQEAASATGTTGAATSDSGTIESGVTEGVAPTSAAGGSSSPAAALSSNVQSYAECTIDESVPTIADYEGLIQMGDPYLGDASAKVVVIELFDPNCPHCRTMHPVLKRVVESHGDKARFYIIPYMLWPQISLLPIEALYVAAQDGKYFEMLELQFMRQNPDGFTPAQLRDMAVEIGLDGNQFEDRLSRGLNRQAIVQRRMLFQQLGIRGTPSIMINGRVIASESKTIACMRQMIDEAAAG